MMILEEEEEVIREIYREMLDDIVKQIVNTGVKWLLEEAKKKDKGRNPPFWTKQWRKS